MLRPKYIWLVYLMMFMLTLYFDNYSEIMGLITPIVVIFDFMRSLGKKIPIRELILTTLSIQTLLVPYLYYSNYIMQSAIYSMAVPIEEYFGFMTPAFLMLSIGISIGKEGNYKLKILRPNNYYKIGRALIITGIIAEFIINFTPGFLAYFVKLFTYSKFIGAYYILFSGHKNRWWWITLAFLNVFLLSIYQTVFQELLGWGMFFTLYLFFESKLSQTIQISIVFLLLIGVFILQNTKINYRSSAEITAQPTGVGSNVSEFISVYAQTSTEANTFSEESFSSNFVRFNQGYIISRIMHHMPESEPFADGETVEDAIYGAIVPRFIDPNKTTVGGGNGLYSRFTGYLLIGTTSMDLSVFGELYANYGKMGGIVACLILGLFYGFVIKYLVNSSKTSPQLLFWLPYLCLIMVRPENGFTPLMNHIFKSAFVLFLLYHTYLKYGKLYGKFKFIR